MNRKSLIGAFALAATLSAPLAFAQSQTPTTDASAQSSTATDTSAQQSTTSNDASAATAGDPAKKSWNDVDVNQDGSLSKDEAAAIPALGQVFDKADSNADGSLSADEYKAYVDKAQGTQK